MIFLKSNRLSIHKLPGILFSNPDFEINESKEKLRKNKKFDCKNYILRNMKELSKNK